MRQAPNEPRLIIYVQSTVIQKLDPQKTFFGHKIDQVISRETEKKLKMLTEEEMLFEDAYVLDYLEEKDFSGTNRQLQVIFV